MGNNNGKAFLQTTRAPFEEPQDHANGYLLRRQFTETYTSLDDFSSVNVNINKYIPSGFSGHPVHRQLRVAEHSPYAYVAVDSPDSDSWYLAEVVPYIEARTMPAAPEFLQTFVFTQTGYSVVGPNGTPAYPYEFNDGVFLEGQNFDFPRMIVKPDVDQGVFDYILQKDSHTQTSKRINFTDTHLRIFKFYLIRAHELTQDPELLTHFAAQFHAYVYMTNFSTDILGWNPVSDAGLTTKMTYPYAMLSDLIFADSYYSYSAAYGVLVVEAMSFVRQWLRQIWDFGSSTHFHYGYLDQIYNQASLEIGAKNYSHFQQELRHLEYIAATRR